MQAYPTIVALSSGSGRAGVAVVRVSGEQVRFALETIAGSVPEARRAVYRALRDPAGAIIDHGLVLFFPAPASFTGEDVAEFHIHGSRAVLSRLLSVLTSLPGLRLAEAGEFTRRAFEAGKLDLAAVEGLVDLIDSETEWQRKQALRQMEGALGRAAGEWRSALIKAMTLLEAEIDFSDEGDVGGPLIADAVAEAQGVLDSLRSALGSFAAGERVREGFVVVLAGPPNAGKSSLLNALARRDVAIVSPIAGTTRDAIEVRLDLGGIPVVLVDTAGLRESSDAIEAEGVRRARQKAAHADLVLRLRSPDSDPERADSEGDDLAVATMIDLGGAARPGEIGVSAATGAGLPELIDIIASRLGKLGQAEPALVTRERQRIAVADAAAAIERAGALSHEQPELIAEELRIAVRALERLIGKVDVEDVLDSLFSGFCIGK
ncbi:MULTISPECIES: tRNA uridine-5-carboxymethylaminomethyl(34) synthesis GTPase MnmE [unclassified Bosea (in: a-proteobacteria)]|uniref:tRNA uridine-5-carboxymethylaminomethyl(34) synthesis GTPase MnmE n=1 Tax=unclassified Bosea (in: a-proteobacteria) TaxID=2653178 RepID=UPI000F753E53|nr:MULTISPECIES: tRNA uridine-5-carboxymethylaminomethyl(34) synthesis GTPase MnmE [unclassified Bosea (in: a-proteobacteria)]AZO79863.1 tRNA uridine-5-carboxymethylaminomethyl(34) synthesis GTPase MnmE [Bosea sp. Tri-49]RXT15875.1 tRNA uridine-5-carboxymethylaminomethyl(34) synthesis GTPase MnmE [Bosea sp. Tri-39]RXT39567.1 tRNA uridine-5-carboxymethylaminomethyl(34) synthesis GTPase MnmE [Bosea sp. Tri-54]